MSNAKLGLEQQIQLALNRWNTRQDTRDIVPEDLILNEADRTDTTEILGLTIKYDNRIQKNHLKIVGKIF